MSACEIGSIQTSLTSRGVKSGSVVNMKGDCRTRSRQALDAAVAIREVVFASDFQANLKLGTVPVNNGGAAHAVDATTRLVAAMGGNLLSKQCNVKRASMTFN